MVSSRLGVFHHSLNVLHAATNVWHMTSSCRLYGIPIALASSVFFALSPRTAASKADDLLASPELRMIKTEWAYADYW